MWNYRNLKAAAASLGALCNCSPQTRAIKMTSQTGLNTTRVCSAVITSSLHHSLGSSVIDSIQKRDIQEWSDSPWWHSCYDAVSLLPSLPLTRPLTRRRCFRAEAGFHLQLTCKTQRPGRDRSKAVLGGVSFTSNSKQVLEQTQNVSSGQGEGSGLCKSLPRRWKWQLETGTSISRHTGSLLQHCQPRQSELAGEAGHPCCLSQSRASLQRSSTCCSPYRFLFRSSPWNDPFF